jgi:hypothetical protein
MAEKSPAAGASLGMIGEAESKKTAAKVIRGPFFVTRRKLRRGF